MCMTVSLSPPDSVLCSHIVESWVRTKTWFCMCIFDRELSATKMYLWLKRVSINWVLSVICDTVKFGQVQHTKRCSTLRLTNGYMTRYSALKTDVELSFTIHVRRIWSHMRSKLHESRAILLYTYLLFIWNKSSCKINLIMCTVLNKWQRIKTCIVVVVVCNEINEEIYCPRKRDD